MTRINPQSHRGFQQWGTLRAIFALSEGDVQQKQHAEKTPLARFWERWDGVADPAKTFASLDAFLKGQHGLPAAKTPPK